MRMVTEEVYLDTKAKQRPWVNESLRRLLYFGVAPAGADRRGGLITGERRQLLLTISDLPDLNRAQVETVAAKDGVPLDALYGVLRALGTAKIPEDPTELRKGARRPGRAPEEDDRRARCAAHRRSRDHPPGRRRRQGHRQGAIVTARKFLDDAVGRVEATSGAVDAAEDWSSRSASPTPRSMRGAPTPSSLAFDYESAADDYAKAFDAGREMGRQARAGTTRTGGRGAERHRRRDRRPRCAEARHRGLSTTILNFIPDGEKNRDWAITRNNMAVVLQTIGERETDTAQLEEAPQIFRDSLDVFEREKDDLNWAAAQNNIGNVLLKLGERESDPKLLKRRWRPSAPRWRSATAQRCRSTGRRRRTISASRSMRCPNAKPAREHLAEAEAAYRLALEEYTREKAPVQWAMVQNNLGNTLNALGSSNDNGRLRSRRPRPSAPRSRCERASTFPMHWAASQLNLGNALNNVGQVRASAPAASSEAAPPMRDALTVFTREQLRRSTGPRPRTISARSTRRSASAPAMSAKLEAVGRRVPGARRGIHAGELAARLGNDATTISATRCSCSAA